MLTVSFLTSTICLKCICWVYMLVIAEEYLNLTWWVRTLAFSWSSTTVVQIQKTGSFTCFYHGNKAMWDGVKKMATINIAITKTDWRKIVLRKIVIHHYFASYWQVILHHLALSAGCAYILSVWIQRTAQKKVYPHLYIYMYTHTHIYANIYRFPQKSWC